MYTKRLNLTAFTLIELLAVITIIGVITAVSMPIYNNYILSSRASAMWALATEAKLEVESTFLRSPSGIATFSVAGSAAPYTTTNSNFVSCVVIKNGVVSVIGEPTQLNSQNIWISFVPNTANNTLAWDCYYSPAAAQYLSSTCQIGGTCSSYGAFGNPVAISATEYFSYGNNPPTTADYNGQCALNPPTFGSCAQCYNFVNTSTVMRYMSYTLISTGPNVFTQQCMQQTAIASNCTAPAAPTC